MRIDWVLPGSGRKRQTSRGDCSCVAVEAAQRAGRPGPGGAYLVVWPKPENSGNAPRPEARRWWSGRRCPASSASRRGNARQVQAAFVASHRCPAARNQPRRRRGPVGAGAPRQSVHRLRSKLAALSPAPSGRSLAPGWPSLMAWPAPGRCVRRRRGMRAALPGERSLCLQAVGRGALPARVAALGGGEAFLGGLLRKARQR